MLHDSWSDLFVTTFYALLEPQTGRLAYANAGHNRPLWIQSSTGQVHELAAHGIALGVLKAIRLEEREICVAPGDTLVFYTDGVTEARNGKGELFWEERLRATLEAHAEDSAQKIQSAILAAVEEFTDGTPLADDLTLFVIKRVENTDSQD